MYIFTICFILLRSCTIKFIYYVPFLTQPLIEAALNLYIQFLLRKLNLLTYAATFTKNRLVKY